MEPDFSTPTASPKTNTLAMVSLGLSIVGIPFLCISIVSTICSCASGLLGIAALITGFIARQQIKSTGEEGDGIAIAGMIIGGAQVVLVVCGVIFVGVLAAMGVTGEVLSNGGGILK